MLAVTLPVLLATPMNRRLLAYTTALGLATATVVAIATAVDLRNLAAQSAGTTPVRGVAAYLGG
jgi:hypothetical protein